MSKLIRGVVVVAGCVLLAGVSVAAEESYVRGYIGEDGRYVPPDVRTSAPPQKLESWSARKKVYQEPVKERTKDVLRAKRPR